MIDYIVHHVKANGTTTPQGLQTDNTNAGTRGAGPYREEGIPSKPISTRKYYAGEHAVEVQNQRRTPGARCIPFGRVRRSGLDAENRANIGIGAMRTVVQINTSVKITAGDQRN